jgi:hypothetical protein
VALHLTLRQQILTKPLIYDSIQLEEMLYWRHFSRTPTVSVSYNSGETFEEPEKIAEITRTVEDMQILAQHNKFVIAIKEWITSTGQHHRRAVSGEIDEKKRTYIQKDCTSHEIQGGN